MTNYPVGGTLHPDNPYYIIRLSDSVEWIVDSW